MEQRNPQEIRSVPEPPRRHSAEHRSCGTEGPALGMAGLGRLQKGPAWLRVCFVRPPQVCLYVWLCIHTCAHRSSLSAGEGEQPPGPCGDRCPSRTPRARLSDAATAARAAAPGSPAGRRKRGRGAEPRPDTATVSGTMGCQFLTLPNRLRHLVCSMRLSLFLSPLPIPPCKSQALQGEDAGGKWDEVLLHALGFVHSPSCTTCTLSAPLGWELG